MDGISLIQTAEGALNEVHAMLQRIRELAVQVSNGTYDPADRKAVQDEVKQLQNEIQRISDYIEFNERKLLNGEIDRRAFPDDDKAAKIVSLSDSVKPGTYAVTVTANATKATLEGGKVSSNFTEGKIQANQAGIININGEEVRIEAGDSAETVFNKLRDLAETVGLNLIAYGDDGTGKPDYNGGAKPFEFNSGMHLVLETKEYGSDYFIDLNASNSTLLADLGLTATKVKGTDVVASIDSQNSDFSPTATVTAKGNIITVTDIDGFTMKLETQDITIGYSETYKLALQAITNTGLGEDIAKAALDAAMQAFAKGQSYSVALMAANSIIGPNATGAINILLNGGNSKAIKAAEIADVDSSTASAVATKIYDGIKDGKSDAVIINDVLNSTPGVAENQVKAALLAFRMEISNPMQVKVLQINVLDAGPLDLQIGANEGQFMEIRIPNLSPQALGIDKINLSTADGAQKAITTADEAINMISSVRSKLGAYQNRLEHTVANLDVAAENMTASLSRIQDADMAKEMSEYTQKNVISQAGMAMLAQANQRPQQILQLLQG
mgnify:CR=1 FL=1